MEKATRWAGGLYTVWALSGLFEALVVRTRIPLSGDVAAVSESILSNEVLFRLAALNDLVSGIIWVVLSLAFYQLFKAVEARQAKLMVALVLVQIPPSFVVQALNLTSLNILNRDLLGSLDPSQQREVALLLLRIGQSTILTLEMFWGLWLFPLAILVFKSRFLPPWIGVWLAVNGVAYVVLSTAGILSSETSETLVRVAMPALMGELVLALWMLFMGANPMAQNPATVHADASQEGHRPLRQ